MTVDEYLGALEPARMAEIAPVREVILRNLPAGYEEVVSKNMLVYQVPFDVHSDTYNGHPLWYAALASQKTGLSLHLMPLYMNDAATSKVEAHFKADGKKLNMGKACIRFKKATDLSMGAIADVIASVPMTRWIALAQSARSRPSRDAQ